MVNQPIRQNRLYQVLHKNLRNPPWVVRPFYRALKITGSPTQYRLRKRLAGEIVAIPKPRMTIQESAGYRLWA